MTATLPGYWRCFEMRLPWPGQGRGGRRRDPVFALRRCFLRDRRPAVRGGRYDGDVRNISALGWNAGPTSRRCRLCAICAPGRVCPNETHCWPARPYGGEYGAGDARPDTETRPSAGTDPRLCRPAHSRFDPLIAARWGLRLPTWSARRRDGTKRRGTISAGNRTLQAFVSRILEATFSGHGAPCPAPSAVCPSVAYCQRSGRLLLVRRCILAGRAATVATA